MDEPKKSKPVLEECKISEMKSYIDKIEVKQKEI